MPPRLSTAAPAPERDLAARWRINDLREEIDLLKRLNETVTADLRVMQAENAVLADNLRASEYRERNLEHQNREKDAILAHSNFQAKEVITAVEQMMLEIESSGHQISQTLNEVDGAGDRNSEDRNVENGEVIVNDSTQDGGDGTNLEESPTLARLDDMLKIQRGMLQRMTAMQEAASMGEKYPEWRNWKYWQRKLVLAAPAGIWMLVAGYLGNLLAGYTGVFLYPKK